ncbi:MAG: CHASE2 domain-containing protein [Minwuia sp.]|uniref:CHASE2 domain-containing protein n=1 Tax=Minwuia sp. TaxID=2493630 RepID=UPI003A8AF407
MAGPADTQAVSEDDVRGQMNRLMQIFTLWRCRAAGLAILILGLAIQGVLVRDDNLIRLAQIDLYQQISPRVQESHLPIIVAVDEESIREEGQWPWPRTKVADLVVRTAEAGPLVVGLDILFLDEDRQSPARAITEGAVVPPQLRSFLATLPDYDRVLADALGRTYSVLALAGTRHGKGINGKPPPARIGFDDLELIGRLRSFPGADRSIPLISDAALGRGLVNAIEDRDAIIRRIPLVAMVDGQPTPGFAVELMRVAMEAQVEVLGEGDEDIEAVRIGDWRIPALPDGTMYVPFSPPYQDRYVSAHKVLAGDPATLARLEGAIAIIGLTGQGLIDFPTTPLRDRLPGIEVHAQAIEAMHEQYFIYRPEWTPIVELLMILGAGVLFIFIVPKMRPVFSAPVVIGTLALVIAVGGIVFALTQIIIFTIGPSIAGILIGITMLLTTLQLSVAQRRALSFNLQRQREERARIQGELDAARDIQFNLLPKLEDVHINDPRYSLAAMLEPARDVGGDLYDFFLIDEDHLFVAVGDVAGKGVPASLFMAVAKALYKSAVMRGIEGIDEITAAANNEISRENPDMLFVTLFAAIIDLNTGEMAFCNAGHEPPLLFTPGSGGEPAPLAGGGGPPICVMDDFPYMPAEHRFSPGETMLITTDGIGEAMNEAGELYGNPRLTRLLSELPEKADAEAIQATIYGDVKTHAGTADPSDDLTILGLRWYGPAASMKAAGEGQDADTSDRTGEPA